MKAKTFFLSLALMSAATLWSATLEQAKSVYNKGDYAKALPMMMEQHKKSPKNGSIAHWLGVCLYNTGERPKQINTLRKSVMTTMISPMLRIISMSMKLHSQKRKNRLTM